MEKEIIRELKKSGYPISKGLESNPNKRMLLVTGHRRENFGEGFLNICEAIKLIATEYEDLDIVYPVHLNPNVREPVSRILSDIPNVYLTEPCNYQAFVY